MILDLGGKSQWGYMIIIIIYPSLALDYFSCTFLINSFFVVLLYAHTRTSFFDALSIICLSEIYVSFPFSFWQYISLSMALCSLFLLIFLNLLCLPHFPSPSEISFTCQKHNMTHFFTISFHYYSQTGIMVLFT